MMPTTAEETAVLAAVSYAALFDYPLTVPQLRESLGVRADEPTLRGWLAGSAFLGAALTCRAGFVYPAGRHDLAGTRRRREAASLTRLRRDGRVLRFVCALPYVRMVAISGSLAHLNAEDGDEAADLDLFVVTAPGRVWLVTLVALVVAKLAGWRRRLCLNYVISEAALAVTPHDLFTANQILHLQPIAGPSTYRRFLAANAFVRAHYPNFEPRTPAGDGPGRRDAWTRLVELVLAPGAPVLERAARALYRWHLLRRAAGWVSRDGVRLDAECLKLHTSSHRERVLTRFEAALHEAVRQARDAVADQAGEPERSPAPGPGAWPH
ncbi:MAG: hypothetical protein AB7O28_14085 [Vicinamibacterales bacterium]